jgi:hypothetical protein
MVNDVALKNDIHVVKGKGTSMLLTHSLFSGQSTDCCPQPVLCLLTVELWHQCLPSVVFDPKPVLSK